LILFFGHGLTNNARPHVDFWRNLSCTESRTHLGSCFFWVLITMHFVHLTVTSSQCRTTQEGAMRSRERYQLPHTQLVTRPPDGHRHGVTQPPSSHASPARLRHAQWRRRPPARTAAGSPTRSRRGATCTGTTPGAPWASTRSSGAAGPGAPASARRATATATLPLAAPAASPRSPAAAADGTCSQD